MKFGYMWEKAKELGCEYIATGHYAKTEYSEKYGRWVLKKSNAGKKDQSYVLWNIPKRINRTCIISTKLILKHKERNKRLLQEHII